MEHIALHSTIHPDAISDYESNHAIIPDELAETFARIGIHSWSIWRSGNRLFHLVACDDFAAAVAALETDPANARWQAHIGQFVAGFHDGDGASGFTPLPRVWDLREQRDSL